MDDGGCGVEEHANVLSGPDREGEVAVSACLSHDPTSLDGSAADRELGASVRHTEAFMGVDSGPEVARSGFMLPHLVLIWTVVTLDP